MSKKTPPLGANGFYEVRNPWTLRPNTAYVCIAIRSFEDLFKRGRDVYSEFYLPKGLVEGSNGFSFAVEQAKAPNIITLRNSRGELLYIPDTYIEKYPDISGVRYERIALSIDLGPIPAYYDLAALKSDTLSFVKSRTGITSVIKEARLPANKLLTSDEHATLEAARQGAITIADNNESRIAKLQATIDEQNKQINGLIEILRIHNLLPK